MDGEDEFITVYFNVIAPALFKTVRPDIVKLSQKILKYYDERANKGLWDKFKCELVDSDFYYEIRLSYNGVYSSTSVDRIFMQDDKYFDKRLDWFMDDAGYHLLTAKIGEL